MCPSPLPELPEVSGLNPAMLSVSELRSLHERLGEWLDAAMAASFGDAPDDEVIKEVRAVLVQVTRERRERQLDERRSR